VGRKEEKALEGRSSAVLRRRKRPILAGGADPVKLVGVTFQDESMAFSNLFLPPFHHIGALKLYDLTALGTNKMMVVSVLSDDPIVELSSPLELPFPSNPAGDNEMKGSIDCGKTDLGILPPDPLVELFCGKMLFCLEEDLKDSQSLLGLFESLGTEITGETLECMNPLFQGMTVGQKG
jgi:hypothetical protein